MEYKVTCKVCQGEAEIKGIQHDIEYTAVCPACLGKGYMLAKDSQSLLEFCKIWMRKVVKPGSY